MGQGSSLLARLVEVNRGIANLCGGQPDGALAYLSNDAERAYKALTALMGEVESLEVRLEALQRLAARAREGRNV